MFTGLVQSLGKVVAAVEQPPGRRLSIEPLDTRLSPRESGATFAERKATLPRPEFAAGDSEPLGGVAVGGSVAVNGCCLTVVEVAAGRWSFEAGPETLRRTNLGRLVPGSLVNLERSLAVGDSLGGHFVTGHIDGVGTLAARDDQGEWTTMWFACAPEVSFQMASKGSIAVDGVSLTLVDVERERFSVALIPHTLAHTTLGRRAVGDEVNLETDLLAKYVQRLFLDRQKN